MTSSITEEFYNNKINAGNYYMRTINYDMSNIYKAFMEQVKPGGCILDAGCGPGRDSLYFIKNGYKVTALDASGEMVKLASELTGLNAVRKRFQEIDNINEFDGIWANASLLHISKAEMPDVLFRQFRALKKGGIIYASFKYGNNEEYVNGRFFNFYDEPSWKELLKDFKNISIIDIRKDEDKREDHKNEYWLYILLRKDY